MEARSECKGRDLKGVLEEGCYKDGPMCEREGYAKGETRRGRDGRRKVCKG